MNRTGIKWKTDNLKWLPVYLGMYTLAVSFDEEWISCVVFMILAASSYCWFSIKRNNLADLTALLLLFWTMGLSVAVLRLSSLHSAWNIKSILCFGGFPFCYLLGEGCFFPRKTKKDTIRKKYGEIPGIFAAIILVSLISTGTFLLEAVVLGFVPLFSKEPHAYSSFHISGVHYFTVSAMLVHSLSMIWILSDGWKNVKKKEKVWLAVANLISFLIAVMCVSKIQFLFIFGLPALVYLQNRRITDLSRKEWIRIAVTSVVLVLILGMAAVLVTKMRHYEEGYLNEVFEFKNPEIPVFIQHPYMYVANNYANFNCLTENLTEHAHGMKQLFPVFALTGLKFVHPEWVNYPNFIVKPEINTLTIIYDAYYDFGMIGVAGFGLILGMVSSFVSSWHYSRKSTASGLIYSQMAIYMILSFFSSWYSVPTTWFWFALSLFLGFFAEHGRIRKTRQKTDEKGAV